MRPTDLKYPYIGLKEKTVLLDKGVLFVPEKGVKDYSAYQFPGWSAHFGNDHPVMIEYCSGNGAWIAAKAQAFPQYNWVAVEKKFDRIRKIWSKKSNFGLNNLLIVYGEASFVTRTYFPRGAASGIYINFPDPWPKRRHWKFRLLLPPFIQELNGCLRDRGDVTIATDDAPYSQAIIRDFMASKSFDSHYPEPYYVHEYLDYGTSYFEDLWRSQGVDIRYHRFLKKG